MRKGALFVILCVLTSWAMAGEKWLVESEPTSLGITCATPKVMSDGVWWTFCDGVGSAHGELRRFHESRALLSQLKIPSTDRLAMLRSVSAQSAWLESEGRIFVGTQDGRVLGFTLSGQLVHERKLGDFLDVKVLAARSGQVWAMSSGTSGVRVHRLSAQLEVVNEMAVPFAKQQAEASAEGERLFFATDRGYLVELDGALIMKEHWMLTMGAELGEPLVTADAVWVGDESGRLHHVSRITSGVWSKVLTTDPLTLAPVKTRGGVWVALEESGQLAWLDAAGTIQRTVSVPFTRSLLSLQAITVGQGEFISVASHGHFALLSSEGELLVKLARPGKELHFGVTSLADSLYVGESDHPLKWRLRPLHLHPLTHLPHTTRSISSRP